jgi:hypothetical protein
MIWRQRYFESRFQVYVMKPQLYLPQTKTICQNTEINGVADTSDQCVDSWKGSGRKGRQMATVFNSFTLRQWAIRMNNAAHHYTYFLCPAAAMHVSKNTPK